MEFPEIYSASGLIRPKKLSMRIVGMLLYPKVDGNGHYGNGRERL